MSKWKTLQLILQIYQKIIERSYIKAWNGLDLESTTPSDYFSQLSDRVLKDFYEKLEIHCKQVLKTKDTINGHNKYRIDHNGDEGVTTLFLDVNVIINDK